MPETKSVCEHKLFGRFTCTGHFAKGPIVCNMIMTPSERNDHCPRYARMSELHLAFPFLWTDEVCCESFRLMAMEGIEDSGCLAGAMDIERRPNDGKMVWRNFLRVIPRFCPYCGAYKPLKRFKRDYDI